MKLTRLLHGSTLRNEDPAAGGGAAPTGVAEGTPPVDDTVQGNDLDRPIDTPALIDPDLNLVEGYQEHIGEYAEGTNYKNLKDVFKTNKEIQAAFTRSQTENAQLKAQLEEVGQEKKDIPSDINEFKEKLEIPELPEGMELSDDVLEQASKYAMEKGYGPKELSDFLAFDLKRAQMEQDRIKNEQFNRAEAAKAKIIEAVGEQNYDMTISNAKFASETLGLPLDSDDLVNQPNMVVALAKIRKSLGEGSLKGANVGGVEISNGSKLQQAEDIITNPENPLHSAFHDSSNPQYEWAQQEHARLIAESGA